MLQEVLNKYKAFPVQVRASMWFLVCSFLQKGISVLTTPIFTRLLSTAEYGQYNVFNSWLGIITVFVSLNLSAGVYSTGLVKFEEDRPRFISSMQGLTLVLLLLWTGIYLILHDFWNQLFSLTTVQMIAMLVMIWTTSVFSFWAAEQRVTYNYKTLVYLTIIVSLLKPIVGIVLVLHAENKVLARILGLVLIELIAYLGLFIIHVRRGRVLYIKKYWKYALAFNIPLVPHYLSQTVLSSADRIMITDMVGDSEAGIYSLAYSLSLIMLLFNSSLLSTISPWIYQRIKVKSVVEIGSVSYIALAIIALVNLVLIAFAPEAVAIFAPIEYEDAIWVIPPVAMSAYFMFCYDLFAKFQFYYEKTQYIMFASVCGAILNIILNYLLIPIFGYYAAGYTTLFCYVVYVIAHYVFMRMVCREYLDDVRVFNTKNLVIITAIFLGLGFLLMFTYNWLVIRYLLIIVLLVILFLKRKLLFEKIKVILSVRKK